MSDLTRWTVKVSKETDIALRSYLAERGGKKGDLSKFIEQPVRKEVLRATVRDIQERMPASPAMRLSADRRSVAPRSARSCANYCEDAGRPATRNTCNAIMVFLNGRR